MKNIKGFTLAEVLITLAIIGVVSALTIPTVITNHRKTAYVTQLKKNYTSLTNGFKNAMAKDGVYQVSDTTMWTKLQEAGEGSYSLTYESYWYPGNEDFKKEFEKIFNVIGKGPKIQYRYFSGNNSGERNHGLVFADGSYMYMWFHRTGSGGHISTKGREIPIIGWIYIDVNGEKSPNQWGRDVYWLELTNDGSIYPHMGRDEYFTEHGNYEGYSPVSSTHCFKNGDGLGCAARIMEESWKMNY